MANWKINFILSCTLLVCDERVPTEWALRRVAALLPIARRCFDEDEKDVERFSVGSANGGANLRTGGLAFHRV